MDWQQSSPLVAKEKGSATSEGMALYGLTVFSYLNAADFDSLLLQFLAASLEGGKGVVLDLFVSALVAEHVELFEYFSFFGFGPASDEQDLIEAESAGTPDYISDVVAFADVVQQQVPFRFVPLHIIILHQQQTAIDYLRTQNRQ